MFVKKIFYKLYLKLIFFSLVFFLNTINLAIPAVLTEEEIKYIESQTRKSDEDKKKEYIQYKNIEKEKKLKKPKFNFFGAIKKKKKKKIKLTKKLFLKKP